MDFLAQRLAKAGAALAMALGTLGLLSWLLENPLLRGLSNPALQMKPNTAVGFILASIALICLINPTGRRRWLGLALALVVTLLGAATLAQYLFDVDFGIDHVFFSDARDLPGFPPGRMSAASAINFLFKGLALLTLDWELRRGRRPSQYLTLITSIVPFLVLVAYGQGSEVVAAIGESPYFTQMSPQTVVAWLSISLATLCVRPHAGFMAEIFSDSHSAAFLRRVLPMAIIVPPLLAWLLAFAERRKLFLPGLGSSVFTFVSVGLLVMVIWRAARKLSQNEAALKVSENALKKHVGQLAKSNAELEQYAYVASHDLKEPLRTVSNYAQMIARAHRGKLGEETDTNIRLITDAIKRMYGLIDALLEYSRAGRDEEPLRLTPSDSLVQAAIRNLEEKIRATNAEIVVGPLPPVLGDPVQVTQVFQNLISNALKYRSETRPRIEIQAEPEGDFVRFAVRDNGIGIDPKYLEKIFLLFQRLHSRDEHGGTGIGLAICKRVVVRHGGRIWAESKPNEGSTFFFTLPKAPPSEPLNL